MTVQRRTPRGNERGAGKGRRRTRRRRTGILVGLSIVFAASALVRLGTIAGEHWPVAAANAADDNLGDLSVAGPTAPLRTALDEVERLRAELARREASVAERERAVEAARTLVEERLAELEAAETRLSDMIAISDTAAETDIDRLTRVYQTMEPEQAAPLFAQMEPSFAAGFLSRMAPAASAALLAELDPQAAYAISVVLATRNAEAPTRAGGPETSD